MYLLMHFNLIVKPIGVVRASLQSDRLGAWVPDDMLRVLEHGHVPHTVLDATRRVPAHRQVQLARLLQSGASQHTLLAVKRVRRWSSQTVSSPWLKRQWLNLASDLFKTNIFIARDGQRLSPVVVIACLVACPVPLVGHGNPWGAHIWLAEHVGTSCCSTDVTTPCLVWRQLIHVYEWMICMSGGSMFCALLVTRCWCRFETVFKRWNRVVAIQPTGTALHQLLAGPRAPGSIHRPLGYHSMWTSSRYVLLSFWEKVFRRHPLNVFVIGS